MMDVVYVVVCVVEGCVALCCFRLEEFLYHASSLCGECVIFWGWCVVFEGGLRLE